VRIEHFKPSIEQADGGNELAAIGNEQIRLAGEPLTGSASR
jgi:hypothetical protein